MKRNPYRHERSPHQRKWPLMLTGVGTLLAAMLLIWLGSPGIGYSSASHGVSMERKNAEESYDHNAPRAMDANSHFIERARAFEAGFKAAFLFHR